MSAVTMPSRCELHCEQWSTIVAISFRRFLFLSQSGVFYKGFWGIKMTPCRHLLGRQEQRTGGTTTATKWWCRDFIFLWKLTKSWWSCYPSYLPCSHVWRDSGPDWRTTNTYQKALGAICHKIQNFGATWAPDWSDWPRSSQFPCGQLGGLSHDSLPKVCRLHFVSQILKGPVGCPWSCDWLPPGVGEGGQLQTWPRLLNYGELHIYMYINII